MKIIGAAFPRTGTMSVKYALKLLGFEKSYHMHEVFLNPQHLSEWNNAITGKLPNWKNLLSGYSATLDVPVCLYWKELMQEFPEAKILLLDRDPEEWYQSMKETVFKIVESNRTKDPIHNMIHKLFFRGFFNDRFGEKNYALNRFQKYQDEVKATVLPEQLLVYRISEGWSPLCRFLNKEEPSIEFPTRNTRIDFQSRNQ